VTEYSAERFKKIGSSDAFVLLTAVWVNPGADDEQAVYANNRSATLAALRQGAATSQESKALLDFRSGGFAANPYFGGD
jgi:5,6,7,8-tetrahydromethanopterin hydro-lyase